MLICEAKLRDFLVLKPSHTVLKKLAIMFQSKEVIVCD
jgi:hypothetical protein